jgi:hypothetical protein
MKLEMPYPVEAMEELNLSLKLNSLKNLRQAKDVTGLVEKWAEVRDLADKAIDRYQADEENPHTISSLVSSAGDEMVCGLPRASGVDIHLDFPTGGKITIAIKGDAKCL